MGFYMSKKIALGTNARKLEKKPVPDGAFQEEQTSGIEETATSKMLQVKLRPAQMAYMENYRKTKAMQSYSEVLRQSFQYFMDNHPI